MRRSTRAQATLFLGAVAAGLWTLGAAPAGASATGVDPGGCGPAADEPAITNEGSGGSWDGYWEGEEWVSYWVADDAAANEPVADPVSPPVGVCPDPVVEQPPVVVDPPVEDPPVEEPPVVEPPVSDPGVDPRPEIPVLNRVATESSATPRPAPRDAGAPDADERRAAQPPGLEVPRFVARTLFSPVLDGGPNPLFVFVLGAAALALYTTVWGAASRRRAAVV